MGGFSKPELYQKITDQILSALDAGVLPWKQPWNSIIPQSIRGRAYRGLNLIILALKPYSDPRWATFNHIRELGGCVRKGEKATWIYLWKFIDTDKSVEDSRTIPIFRAYTVFNVEQCEGLMLSPIDRQRCDETPIDQAERIICNVPWNLEIRNSPHAYWSPSNPNAISIPEAKTFDSMNAYYSTLFHEIAHATGHVSKLNRDMSGHFGDEQYGFEELVAQFASAFVCASAGIDNTIPQDAAYIEGWARTLRRDPKMIIKAAGLAQKAADYILGSDTQAEIAA